MSEERKDRTWKGEVFREHVAEIRKVIRPSTPEEIDPFGRRLEGRAAKAEGGAFRASVLSDSEKATEYTAESFAELWGKVRSHLLEPEARWLEAEISWPKFSSKIENRARNVKRITFSYDGQGLLKSEAIPCPLPPGTEIPADEPDRLSKWLASLAESLSDPRQEDHPTFVPALSLHGGVIRALELIERKGKDSPEAKALELGVRIATLLAEIQTINRAPEILKNTRINRKKPGKGKQKHAKKTEPMSHLHAEIHRIIQEGHDAGNRMWPRHVLDQLEEFRMERNHFKRRKDNHRIRHEEDDESLSVLHLRKTVIPLAIEKICKK